MSEKYNIEELIIRFLQQDINEEELRYLVHNSEHPHPVFPPQLASFEL